MAALVTNFGKQRIGIYFFHATGYNVNRYAQTMAWDNGASGFAAGHDQLNDAATPSSEYDQAFDATPTIAAQTVTAQSTIPTGQGNFTITRISIHDDAAANVSVSSTTLVSGVDGQSLGKTSDFTLRTDLSHQYT